ncbi:hypothetical protein J8273_4624 [Carpediemonas membranifera]|uniref:Uncharacterized protein n=1 Tax=Carpediemonas membranifera TaxID=201153 RepID=A0A8J6E216_9EUKA|nr:hypothetical protein J8273_4624 [Carpediemonas membranifera]|eukprot:KAG9393761.1 hypothetical protein J8273_4624 [Carpediemonas membranifera]
MVQLEIDYNFPRMSAKELDPRGVKKFKAEVRVFRARIPDYATGLLLSEELQEELEATLGVSAESATSNQVYEFLESEATPRSLLELKRQLRAVLCPKLGTEGYPSNLSVVRQLGADFVELADYALRSAAKEGSESLAALFGKEKRKMARLLEDGTAEVVEEEALCGDNSIYT